MFQYSLGRRKLCFRLRRVVIITYNQSKLHLIHKKLFLDSCHHVSMLSQASKALLSLTPCGYYNMITRANYATSIKSCFLIHVIMFQCSVRHRKLCFRLCREVIITYPSKKSNRAASPFSYQLDKAAAIYVPFIH